jgi:hypothetical protein
MGNLSKLAASWKKVEPIAFSNVPDGDYLCDLKEITLGQSKAGRWQVVLSWEIADGEYVGKVQKQFYGITDNAGNADATGMGYLKAVTEVLGIDLPDDPSEWQEHFDAYVGSLENYFECAMKANGNYVNVYINQMSETTKGGEEQPEEEAGDPESEAEAAAIAEEEAAALAEEEEQQVQVPTKKVLARPLSKPAAMPVKKVAAVPVKKVLPSLKRR